MNGTRCFSRFLTYFVYQTYIVTVLSRNLMNPVKPANQASVVAGVISCKPIRLGELLDVLNRNFRFKDTDAIQMFLN